MGVREHHTVQRGDANPAKLSRVSSNARRTRTSPAVPGIDRAGGDLPTRRGRRNTASGVGSLQPYNTPRPSEVGNAAKRKDVDVTSTATLPTAASYEIVSQSIGEFRRTRDALHRDKRQMTQDPRTVFSVGRNMFNRRNRETDAISTSRRNRIENTRPTRFQMLES
ncbi:MAG: hypothetical protein AAFO91_00160 [Bacteroidota bacterium]